MAEYKVQFEVFEGPLDLLLYLIKKEEVDIYEVNLTQLATRFIEQVELMRMLDLEIAGEFLVMASTLMYIKSRELLPKDLQTQDGAEDEDEEDPRWELIRQLVEYKKFKDAASRLQEREWEQENIFHRLPARPEMPPLPAPPSEASLFDLINAVSEVLKRVNQRGGSREIFEDKWSVSEKIEFLLKATAERDGLKFSELFDGAISRAEVVCTFLALLELIRLKQLVCLQAADFGEIEITRAADSVRAQAGAPGQTNAV